MKKFCVKCGMDKPESSFVKLRRGRCGEVSLYVCGDCAKRLKDSAGASQEARDAFGRRVTDSNKAAKSAMARHARNANTRIQEKT